MPVPITKTHYRAIITRGLSLVEQLEQGLLSDDTDAYLEKQPKRKATKRPHNLVLASEYDSVSNVAIINSFPNALLLEDSIFEPSKQVPIEKPQVIVPKKEETIWEHLKRLRQEQNTSETIADLDDSDSETSEAVCDGCGSKGSLVETHDGSSIVCSECGKTHEDLLDQGPEWRTYFNDDNRGGGIDRCGCPTNFFFPKSSQGTIMTGPINNRLKRKQKWVSMVYKERSLNQVFEIIMYVCARNKLPKIIVDDAKIFYKLLSECKHKGGKNQGKQIIIRGKNRRSIIAACVFKACEKNKQPRNTKEIAAFFELDEKKVTKGIKQFGRNMKNSENNQLLFEGLPETDTTEDYIRRHCPKLRISKPNTDLAVKISQNCCKMKLASDHNPQSVAAGSILVMVAYRNLAIDKRDISKLFGTSDVTISKIFNKVHCYVDALVNDECTNYLIQKLKING